jgi:hypothetical protein
MTREPVSLYPDKILEKLGKLFMTPAHDRHVYTVFGDYSQLRPFQRSIREQVRRGDFNNTLGKVEYLSLNDDLIAFIRGKGLEEKADQLARNNRKEEMRRLLSDSFRHFITQRIEAPDTLALILADFELLYAYDLGENDISIVRQVAINGKRICLLVPGAMRDGRLWIFDNDLESRREFPEPLLFLNSGWVFSFQLGNHK